MIAMYAVITLVIMLAGIPIVIVWAIVKYAIKKKRERDFKRDFERADQEAELFKSGRWETCLPLLP